MYVYVCIYIHTHIYIHTYTLEKAMKHFCRWIIGCFMCAHELSYVYSHVWSKAPCVDDNLVR